MRALGMLVTTLAVAVVADRLTYRALCAAEARLAAAAIDREWAVAMAPLEEGS